MKRENDTKLNVSISTGFVELDDRLKGMRGGELLVVGGRPAMGKTSFALNIVQYVAMKAEVPCVIFSLEMSKEQLTTRLTAMDFPCCVGSDSMFIDDTPGITIEELCFKCHKLKQTQDIGLIIIDYLQLMNGSGCSQSRQQEISEISHSLKKLARELNVPVIVLSQLNRAVDSRKDRKPVVSDLHESGTVKQDADVIMFIYRDAYYNRNTDKPNTAEIIIAKNNNGDAGTVELRYVEGSFFDQTEGE